MSVKSVRRKERHTRVLRQAAIALLAAVAVLLLTPSCRHRSAAWQQMDRAEAAVDEAPDSALALLQSINADSLADSEERARHALLLTYALYKNDVPLDTDTLLRTASDHYRHRKNTHEYMLTRFCEAEIAYNRGEYERAMQASMDSHEQAAKLHEPFYQAKNAEAMGDLFSLMHNHAEAAKCTRDASRYYGEAGKERNSRFALVDYANALSNNREYQQAISVLDSLEPVMKTAPVDSTLLVCVLQTRFITEWRLGDDKKLEECIAQLEGCGNTVLDESPTISAIIAERMFNSGRIDEGTRLLEPATEKRKSASDSIAVYYAWSSYHRQKGDYRKSLEYRDSMRHLENAELLNSLRQSATATQRDYFKSGLTRERDRNNLLRCLITVIVISAILLALAGFYVHRLKIREKDAKLQMQIQYLASARISIDEKQLHNDEITEHNLQLTRHLDEQRKKADAMESELEAKEHQLAELRQELDRKSVFEKEFGLDPNLREHTLLLYGKSLTTLHLLCEGVVQMWDCSAEERQASVQRIINELGKLRQSRSIKEMEKSVDKYKNGIISKLREQCRFISKKDLQMLCFILAGFSYDLIGVILNTGASKIANRKFEILKQIKSSGAKDKELFIYHLDSRR